MSGQEPEERRNDSTIPDGPGLSSNSGSKSLAPLNPGDLLGRYQILSLLGSGGFGTVYRAIDLQLHRHVAIKVPLSQFICTEESVERYLNEARLIAQLDHPNIVPIFDWGRDTSIACYFVTKFVDGQVLSRLLAHQQPDFLTSAKICRDIALALHCAHRQGIIHRDVKPGNIITDNAGRPFLIDFGLALNDESYGTACANAGTPSFMSPEQARGEGHLVDGRSDVYSLGVVLYRMISGRMPSAGATPKEMLHSVAYQEPKPPRQINDNIPRELERICLRAIAKRASDRYTTAKDFADDLDAFQIEHERGAARLTTRLTQEDVKPLSSDAAQDTSVLQALVVPKGLRAFDEEDADFFLSLLPGPVDRLGVPERVRFLKKLVEESRVDRAEPVAVIYGPSGCGKSSLIRAGLIPRLSERTCTIIIEASAHDTEASILSALRRFDPIFKQPQSLADAFAKIRLRQTSLNERKVAIFIDQFEQWLNARTDYETTELVAALRQCDGVNLQCVLSVRDDFWVAVSRLLREVEVEVREGQNAALIDLFDISHARRVLTTIGRAYGGLPKSDADMTREHQAFLDRAIEELSERGRVVPVRLSVFAQMMKDKQWHLKNLEYVGGCEGIGVAFLNENFNVPEAPTRQKRHASGAQRVLAMMIPQSGEELKGSLRTASELRAAAGYPDARDFDDLMKLLDSELRLLTPVAHLTNPEFDSSADLPNKDPAYQLTHDYLVTPLRNWLAQKQRGTLAGRALLKLEETTGFWSLHRDKKLLPSLWEWAFIRLFVSARKWTEPQRAMMTAAGRAIGRRTLVLTLIGCIILFVAIYQVQRIEADIAYKRLLAVPVAAIPESIEELRTHGSRVFAKVYQNIDNDSNSASQKRPLSEEQFRLRLAASVISHQRDPRVEIKLLQCDPETIEVANEIFSYPDTDRDSFLWSVIEAIDSEDSQHLRAACLLAPRGPSDPRWVEAAPRIAATLAREPFAAGEAWAELLDPASKQLLDAVSELIVAEPTIAERPRLIALAWYFSHGATAQLTKLMQIAVEDAANDPHRRAAASAALAELSDWQFSLSDLAQQPDPTLRTHSIAALEAADIEVANYLTALENNQPNASEAGVRAGLLICLSNLDSRRLTNQEWEQLYATVEKTLDDPLETQEARSVGRWLLAKWDNARSKPLNTSVRRMIPITLPASLVEDNTEPWRFEISSCEVTVEEFLQFRLEHHYDPHTASSLDCPVNEVTWFDAIAYCNWLSKQAGLDPDQWCYVPSSAGDYDAEAEIPDDIHKRRGFRLPTTTEYEFSMRAGTETKWSWGSSASMANRYAWTLSNSGLRTHPVGQLRPNPFGLFDTYGNVWEWTHDTPEPSGTSEISDAPRFLRGGTFLNEIESTGWEVTIANAPLHKTGADGFRVVRRIFD